ISVSSCWAWSVMPSVATSPLTRSHSCDFAYFRSDGILAINRLRHVPVGRSTRFLRAVNGPGNDQRGSGLAADFNGEGSVWLGKLRRHITETDANPKRRTLSAADDLANFRRVRPRAPNCVMRAGRGGLVSHLEGGEFLAGAARLLLGERRAADELAFVLRHEKTQPGFQRCGVFVQLIAVGGIA